MKFIYSFLLFLIVSTIHSQNIQSPSKALTLNFTLSENGKPNYTVTYKNKPIILESFLGLKLKGGIDLTSNFKIDSIKTSTLNETWKPVLGEQATIKNHYNELTKLFKTTLRPEKKSLAGYTAPYPPRPLNRPSSRYLGISAAMKSLSLSMRVMDCSRVRR